MRIIRDIRYKEEHPRQALDIYLPDTDVFSTLIYMHGGGLEGGDKADTYIPMSYLAQNGIAAVSINYRIYPDASYPQFIDDSASAVSWVYHNMKNYGTCRHFFVGGSSAGGYLSMMLCFDKRYLNKHGISPEDMSGYIFDAGQPTVHFNVLRERGLDSRRVIIDEAAPLYHVEENANAAPMLIIVAEHDLENRYEQTMLFTSTLKHFNYPQSKVKLIVMKDKTHCQYGDEVDADGNSVLGCIINDFIHGIEKGNSL
ncbi:MAG TPA: alpha/beta hydrolase [Clostridiaceae bacterium]|nr:alpha/beta hydrolase [Clostridiaceae bacterium]